MWHSWSLFVDHLQVPQESWSTVNGALVGLGVSFRQKTQQEKDDTSKPLPPLCIGLGNCSSPVYQCFGDTCKCYGRMGAFILENLDWTMFGSLVITKLHISLMTLLCNLVDMSNKSKTFVVW
jgi:hypothetical protein